MVVLTGLLGLMAVLCSWNEIEKYQGFFHLPGCVSVIGCSAIAGWPSLLW